MDALFGAATASAPVADPVAVPTVSAPPPPVAATGAPPDELDEAAAEEEATVVQAPPAPAPRTLDENLLAILREEAARETAVRRAEAPAMPEVQPDLGLPETTHAVPQAPQADVAPADPAEPEAVEANSALSDRVAPRRDLLPDIEEINSTLRAGSEARGAEAEAMVLAEKARARSGFRAGFIVTLMIAIVLTTTYTMAPRIAEHLPGSAPVMASYVQGVDVARIWLDGALQQAAGALRGLTGETP